MIGGPPGSGKTILAQQMCFANATAERPALYYTTWSEPHDKLVRHLAPFAFFDDGALGERVEFVHLADLVSDNAAGLTGAADEILRRSVESKPSVIVIDSSKALHDVVEPGEFRRTIYDLASKVAYSDAVLILVGEYSAEETRTEPEFAVADGIIQLENEANGPIDRRRLRVLKMRGAEVMSGQHSFRLGSDGFEAFPRLETTLPRHVPAQDGRAELRAAGARRRDRWRHPARRLDPCDRAVGHRQDAARDGVHRRGPAERRALPPPVVAGDRGAGTREGGGSRLRLGGVPGRSADDPAHRSGRGRSGSGRDLRATAARAR